jgi:GWxTD domain-containing protein
MLRRLISGTPRGVAARSAAGNGIGWRRAAARVALALCALLLARPACGAEGAADDPGKEWRNGPVRYLLTGDEYERYGRLRTAEARSAFVARFWRRLDPDPETPENGFKERFYKSCELADERYGTPVVAGWRTDRGRVLVLLGEPDAVRRIPGDPFSVVREVWTYSRRPGGRADPLEIVFYGDRSGQFRLKPPPGSESDASRDPVELIRELNRVRAQAWLEPMVALPRDLTVIFQQLHPSDYLAAMLLGAHTETPRTPDRETRAGSGSAGTEGSGPLSPIASDASYFFLAADGATMALLALEYGSRSAAGAPATSSPAPLDADASAVAWIFPADDRGSGRVPPEAVVRLDRQPELERGGVMMFTGRAHLEPGSYEARYVVDDRSRKLLAIRDVALTVPEIPLGELAASTVVPAERFGPVAEGRSSAFAVGSEEVVPKPGASFRPGEPLRVYLQVYGAMRDPSIREPRVDVTFRFERTGERRPKRQGNPVEVKGAAGGSMGLTLPMAGWPTGSYRVEIDLVDRVSGARATTEGRFRISD